MNEDVNCQIKTGEALLLIYIIPCMNKNKNGGMKGKENGSHWS